MPVTRTDKPKNKPRVLVNEDHPAYCAAKEIACMVPCSPAWAVLDDIAKDLGLTSKQAIAHLEKAIELYSLPIDKKKISGSWCVRCEKSWWPVLRHNTNAYWKEVYGE